MTTKKFNRPHIIIPEEDTTWAVDQKPCVMKFWQQCWLADPYGSRWMKLVTNLSDSAFRFARRVLEAARLFVFRRVSYSADRGSSVWEVLNLHGARVKDFWQNKKNEADTALNEAVITNVEAVTALFEAEPKVESQSEQEFQKPSVTLQEHISNSSKELLMCESSTHSATLGSSQTADAPLGGASPSNDECVDEVEKESVMGLIESNEDTLVVTCSASFDSLETSQLPDRDGCSAAASDLSEKWSNEAIAARMQLRPRRMDKLKKAGMFGDSPGFTYLQECWDDPSLRIMVRRLIVKFPQWKVACMDEELLDWGDA